jgi:hypothetical protein
VISAFESGLNREFDVVIGEKVGYFEFQRTSESVAELIEVLVLHEFVFERFKSLFEAFLT